MNKNRTLMPPENLDAGDVVQFATAASPFTQGYRARAQKTRHTYGYVLARPEEETGGRTNISVFEIVHLDRAQQQKYPFITVHPESAGLDANHKWAVVFAPVGFEANHISLGRRDGLIQRVGRVEDSAALNVLEQQALKAGESLLAGHGRALEGAPKLKTPSVETWGLFAKGLGRKNFNDEEFTAVEKKTRRRKHDFTTLVPDMDIADAVRTLGLPKDIADIVGTAHGRKNPPVASLRTLWDMAQKEPEKLQAYVPEGKALSGDFPLKKLVEDGELHPAVGNGLAKPRDGSGAAPVTDLKAAFALVSRQDIDVKAELQKYSYLKEKNADMAVKEITALYEKLAAPQDKAARAAQIADAAKSVWKDFMSAYAGYVQTGEIKPALRGNDGRPVWKMVPQKQQF